MGPTELMQLAVVLDAQALPLLKDHTPDSQLIRKVVSMLDELPGMLEAAFEEAELLDQLARETRRQQKLSELRFRFGASIA